MAIFTELHDLTGKAAIVTGGSRGIGRAIAQALAGAGADVAVASRKLDACQAVAAEIRTRPERSRRRSPATSGDGRTAYPYACAKA